MSVTKVATEMNFIGFQKAKIYILNMFGFSTEVSVLVIMACEIYFFLNWIQKKRSSKT